MADHAHTENEQGVWCSVCGEHIAAPHNIEERDPIPDDCPNCGWPDEFDPEKV